MLHSLGQHDPIWPRSSPDGAPAPPPTACTMMVPTHTSKPAAESTRLPTVTLRLCGCGRPHFTIHTHSNPIDPRQRSQVVCISGRLVHLDQTTALSSCHKIGRERHPHHQPRAATHQDPDLESLVHQPHPAHFPDQSQVNIEVPWCTPPYRRRQRRKPSGTGWTNIHEHRHAALPKQIDHNA